jgi:hypothetical protein
MPSPPRQSGTATLPRVLPPPRYEIQRTMSYAGLLAKLERYDAYRSAPPSGRGNAARAPRSHWQQTYAGPSMNRPFPPLLFVFAPPHAAPHRQRRKPPSTTAPARTGGSPWRPRPSPC